MNNTVNEVTPVNNTACVQYREIEIKSAVPIWGAAAVWLLAGCTMPMYKLYIVILTALFSLAVYGLLKLILPKKTVKERIPFSSGNLAVDEIVNRMDESMEIISADSKKIFAEKPKVSDDMNAIISYILKVREDILQNPEKIKKISRFLNYYLPTTVKLSDKYVYLMSQRTNGQNVTEALSSIESAFDRIRSAFCKQHDALFEAEALDMSTDVAVLETLLKQDTLDNNQ